MPDYDDDSTADGQPQASPRAFMRQVRERWKLAEDAEGEQRQRELADLRFYAGEQWPEDVRQSRAGQGPTGGMPAVPARPTLTINKTREPVRQVLNQERQSDMGIEIVPADDFGNLGVELDEREIQLREGLTRRIQRESIAADARTWAFARAVIAGRGYYGVMTRYLPGKTWDQELYVHRYYNQASVLLDPYHEQPDGSDAEWGFVGTDMSFEEYKREFGKRETPNRVADADDDEWRALGDEAPGWFTTDGDLRNVRVVDYWYIEPVSRTLALLEDGTAAWRDELPAGTPVKDTREVTEKRVKWCKLDGTQKLDETDWPGPDIPIVKVLGEELQPYDRERRVEGMVRPSRDSSQGYNAMVSKWVETVGLAPIPPMQMAEGQWGEYMNWYMAANTRTLPFLPYKQTDLAGQPAPPPFRTAVDTPIQAIAGAVQMFDQAIQATTGVGDPTLGRADPTARSGKAIRLLQEQSAHGTSNYLDNLKRSIRYEGQIINNLLYPIYGKPGRLVRILTGEGESETVQVQAPGASRQPGGRFKGLVLSPNANFNVIVKVTRAYDSRREQEASIIAGLIESNPQLLTIFGDLFFKNQDGPGHIQMAERAKAILDPRIQQMLAQRAQGVEIPPEVQAQMAQLQGNMQQLEQVAQQQKQELDTRSLDHQTKLRIAQMDNATKLQIAAAEQETKLTLEAQKADATSALALMQAQIDRLGQELEHRHAAQMGAAATADQEASAQAQRQYDAEQAAAGAEHVNQQAEQARQFEAQQTAEQRAAEQAQLDSQAAQAQNPQNEG